MLPSLFIMNRPFSSGRRKDRSAGVTTGDNQVPKLPEEALKREETVSPFEGDSLLLQLKYFTGNTQDSPKLTAHA